MPRPHVVNHFVGFAVKDPKRHILNALGVEPGVEGSGRGDGGGEAVGVLVDGGEGSHGAHGVAEHIDAVGVDLVLLAEFRIDEFEDLIEHAVDGLGVAAGFFDAFDHLGAELAHAFGQVIDGDRTGLGVELDFRGVVEPAAVGLRCQHEGGVPAAEVFVGQILVPAEYVLDVLRAAPAPAVQAEDEWVGFAGVEVDGFHQAVLDALELAGHVEGEGLGGDPDGQVLCGGGKGDEEEEDHGVDEMPHGGFLCMGISR